MSKEVKHRRNRWLTKTRAQNGTEKDSQERLKINRPGKRKHIYVCLKNNKKGWRGFDGPLIVMSESV